MKTEFQTHDLTLPAWGPYTKKYSGISHIPQAMDGVRFDLAVFPGFYRRRVDVPNVRFESGYHVWAAAPDLACYTLRHELAWKDQVYADVSFADMGPQMRLIRTECCNQTEAWQNLVLHYMASAHDPSPSYRNFVVTGCHMELPEGAVCLLAKDYADLTFAVPRPTDHLNWDGMRRAEEPVEGFAAGYGIGLNFGCAAGVGLGGRPLPSGAGDWVRFEFSLTKTLEKPCLGVRYVNPGTEAGVFTLSTGQVLTLPPTQEPALVFLPLETGPVGDGFALELTAQGQGHAKLDCLVLLPQGREEEVRITPRPDGHQPEIRTYPGFITLKYPHIREVYGIAWMYDSVQLRQILHDELDVFLRDTVHDHVHDVLQGNGKGHFTNVFHRPIPLAPGERKVLYGVVCSGESQEQVCQMLSSLDTTAENLEEHWQRVAQGMAPAPALESGRPFALGQQLMQAVLCTNVVYPVYTRGQYIRHNTPGRWWDCLYTWDSGFIGMALAQFSARRGFDCLNAYLTPPGDDETAFIHHGSLVPVQFYLYQELLNQTGSRELAQYCYPRLLQYYRFYTGQTSGSTTANLKSGLLRPWDYFYNSGGWDDYPPQVALRQQGLEASCTPVITTAHGIRCAKILAHTARLLGLEADGAALEADARRMEKALSAYAWDEESGYFGYVRHNEQGEPAGIFRADGGCNYNMGLGGASPLFAGACDESQQQRLWEKLESSTHLWSSCGLSTVDQSAPYYRRDGYWNGAVWMPYQWMFFKAALDAGRTEFAFQIAQTMLSLWQQECAESYHCFEHFMIETRRGAGWHQFGGLSSPIVQFFASYYRPGTLTCGFDTFVESAVWSEGNAGVSAELTCTHAGPGAFLVALSPGEKTVTVSVPQAQITQRHPGLWEIQVNLPQPGNVHLQILEA